MTSLTNTPACLEIDPNLLTNKTAVLQIPTCTKKGGKLILAKTAKNLEVDRPYPYLSLIQLRTVGSNPTNPIVPITTLQGRLTGNNVKFNNTISSSYEDFCMRRKAEYLKVNKNTYNVDPFSNAVKKTGNKISFAQLTQLIKANKYPVECPPNINITLPTNAGVVDRNFRGYYLDPNVSFYPSL